MVAVLTLAPPFAEGQALEDRLPFVDPSRQYLIQTDQGPERLFRYQTLTGQFRKEKRLEDGSVTGSYGWVDPNGVLRLYDYVSDNLGYRQVFMNMNIVNFLEAIKWQLVWSACVRLQAVPESLPC